ncbi:MAG: hypothetical protein K1X67_05545 [Fimbriimonadaceae bacterium]|nr:hypothetical protein [Fimbriimonadaceae bacterium]
MATLWQALRNKWTRYKRIEPFFYVDGENLTWNEYDRHDVLTKRWMFTADDIVKIVAYKLDLFTVDRVQVDVTFRGGAEVTLTEDGQALMAFDQYCRARLDGYEIDWKEKVIYPAFERCERVVYERSEAESKVE